MAPWRTRMRTSTPSIGETTGVADPVRGARFVSVVFAAPQLVVGAAARSLLKTIAAEAGAGVTAPNASVVRTAHPARALASINGSVDDRIRALNPLDKRELSR